MVSLLTLWLAVQWIVLHDVNRWRPWVVQLLSQSVGTAVTVDRLAPGKFHLLPTLVLEGVTVQDPTGHPGLQVQRIQARVDPWDFLQGRLDFDRLVIDQPRLVLRRDSAGHLSLSGIPLPGPGAGPSPFFDWLIHQGEIRLNGGELLWRDELRHAPDLLLRQVELDLRNGAGGHRMSLDMVPPRSLSSPLHASLTLRGLLWGHWRDWEGHGQVDGARIDWAALAPWVDGMETIERATGALHVKADLTPARGVEMRSEIDFHPLVWRLSDKVAPLSIAQLTGKLALRWQGDEYRLSLHQVRWVDRSYPHAERPLDMDIRMKGMMTQVKAAWLDLALLKPLSRFLPLSEQQRQVWDVLAPSGQVQEAELSWNQGEAWQDSLRFTGQLHHTSFNAWHGVPEIHSFSGVVTMTAESGHIKGSGLTTRWDWPAWFVEPINLQSFQVDMDWQKKAETTMWDVHRLQLVNDDLDAQVSGTWEKKADHGFGVAHWKGRLTRARPEAVWRYLPRQIPVSVRNWLHHALTEGQVTAAGFSVDGDLGSFPFTGDQGGTFRVLTDFSRVRLQFDPAWPALSHADGSLAIQGTTLSVNVHSGEIGGAKIGQAYAQLADFTQDQSVLRIAGQVDGSVQDGLKFIAQSPVRQMIGGGLDGWSGSGIGHLMLALQVPLSHPAQTAVQGDYVFSGATLDGSKVDIPPLEGISGKLHFTERGVDSEGLHAQVLGGPARFQFSTDEQGIVHLDGDGQGDWTRLRRLYHQSLLNDVSGMEPWQIRLVLKAHQPGITLWTHVNYLDEPVAVVLQSVATQGLELRLWGATSARALRKRFGSQWLDPLGNAVGWHGVGILGHGSVPLKLVGDGVWLGEPFTFQVLRGADEHFTASLNGHLSVIALQQWRALHLSLPGVAGDTDWSLRATGSAEKLEQWWLSSSLTGVSLAWPAPLGKGAGGVLPLTLHGTNQEHQWQVEGQLANWLEGRTWLVVPDTGEKLGVPEVERAALWLGHAPPGAPMLPGFVLSGQWPVLNVDAWQQLFAGKAGGDGSALPGLDRFDVRFDKLIWHGRQWSAVHLSGVGEGHQWTLRAQGPMIEGVLTWVTEPPGRLTGQMSHLVWPDVSPGFVSQKSESSRTRVADMPALDIQIERLDMAPSFSGRLQVVGDAQGESSWRLQKLALESSSTQGKMEGEWQDSPQPHHHYRWQFKTGDMGRFLTDIGYPGLLQRGKGEGEGVLEWSGGWTDFSLLALKAEAKLDLNDGQFSKIQPGGVGRLISLFSLQTLPRRITLDFRDVFSEGFAFDHLNVDLALDHEKLTTRDFEMAGPAARVSMTGEVDLQQETTQLEAQVEPALGGSVTLASAVVGGPVVGAASWLVQKILGNPFDKALSYDYTIQGPWDAPDIRPIQRP